MHNGTTRNYSPINIHLKNSYETLFIVNDSVEVLSMENANATDGDNVWFTPHDINSGREKHAIVILGDRHASWCANKIKDKLNKNFNVTGFKKQESDILTLQFLLKVLLKRWQKMTQKFILEEALKMLGRIIL